MDIVFIDDKSIAKLAGRFRNSPHATDVLSFHYGDPQLEGEIAISIDTAARQAKERKLHLRKELLLLCVHGLLHLSGLDDETPAAWLSMRRAEFETMIQIL